MKYRVSKIQNHHKAVRIIVLHPAEVEIVPYDGHGQRTLDLGEPTLDRTLKLALALYEERVGDHVVFLQERFQLLVDRRRGGQHNVAGVA